MFNFNWNFSVSEVRIGDASHEYTVKSRDIMLLSSAGLAHGALKKVHLATHPQINVDNPVVFTIYKIKGNNDILGHMMSLTEFAAGFWTDLDLSLGRF